MAENSKLNKILKIVGASVIVLAILLLAFFGGTRYQKKVDSATEQYLQEQVELYQKEANNWKSRYEFSLEEKNTLLLGVDSLETEIKKLKKKYGQKVTTISTYSNPELERFFAERYGD